MKLYQFKWAFLRAFTMINGDYIYTSIFKKIEDFSPELGSTYLYGHSTEMRSHCVDELIKKNTDSVKFVKVEEEEKDVILDTTSNEKFHLRSSKSMSEFFQMHESTTLYIDVTGLEKRIIAALLNNAIKAISKTKIRNVKTIYAEPESYDIKQFQSEGIFNDLSEKIEGIKPLPGFASIFPEDIDNILFVALLGFEGGRFTYMLENVQPPRGNIIPIIGVPGFRAEYPFVAYWGNRRPLEETETWRRVKYAVANSLVDVYVLLSDILRKNLNVKIKLAPIGTKPHLIGAILFAIKNPKQVELVYDNPKRKKKRTSGVGKIVECSVSKLLQER